MRISHFISILFLLTCCNTLLADDFLPNWMGRMLPVLRNQTLLDLSLPGTHDSLTYDLSTVVSDGADDDSNFISWVLHYASLLGITPSEWIRNQSKTQGLDVTGQLDNGVRFIDLRVMYTSEDWYSLHFMQSNQKALTYLTQIRTWLDSHPQEIIVLWISKHGSPCKTGNDQYPGVSIDTKRAFWSQIQVILGDLIINVNKNPLNGTTISNLIYQNQRVAIYATDYQEFTNNSPFAMDGCLVDNNLCDGVDNELNSYTCLKGLFKNAHDILAKDKKENKFFLVSMASSGAASQLEYLFLATYIEIDRDTNIQKCAATFDIPGMKTWCPPHLQDVSQLTNYYNQLPLEDAFTNQWYLPNAIYLDALDVDGTIRTGTQLFGPYTKNGKQHLGDNEETKYGYVSTLLLCNLRNVCGSNKEGDCGALSTALLDMRAKYPVKRWNDVEHGRLVDWPV